MVYKIRILLLTLSVFFLCSSAQAVDYKMRFNNQTGRGDWVVDSGGQEFCLADGTNCSASGSAAWESASGQFRPKTSSVSSGDSIAITSEETDGSSAVAYIFDTKHTMSTGGAKIVSIRDAGTELIVIDENGNIGIGNTAPSTALQVNGTVTASAFAGNASTATALASNGSNCSSGSAPLGVDDSGASEGCFDVWTEAENTSAAYISASSSATLTNKTFDANGTGNSLSNVDLSADVTGNLPVNNLNGGTGASSSTFWRGDATWATPSGGASDLDSAYAGGATININLIPVEISTTKNSLSAGAIDVSEVPFKIRNPANDTNEVVGLGFDISSSSNNLGGFIGFQNTGNQGEGSLIFGTKKYTQVVSLALDFEGTDGATTTTDESSSAHTMTFVGNAQIDTAIALIETSSLLLDGTGDRVTTPVDSTLNFGSGDWTIEFTIQFAAQSGDIVVISTAEGTRNGWSLRFGSNNMRFNYGQGSTIVNNSHATTTANSTEYHVAVCRDGSTLRFWQDGASVATEAISGSILDATSNLIIGNGYIPSGTSWDTGTGLAQDVNGSVDRVQIYKGTCLYTADFSGAIPSTGLTVDESGGDISIRQSITEDGYVGIGYTTPGTSLAVNGNVGIGQSTASTALDVNGTATATIFTSGTVALQQNASLGTRGVSGGSGSSTTSFGHAAQDRIDVTSNAINFYSGNSLRYRIFPTSTSHYVSAIPSTTNSIDLGSNASYWRTAYIGTSIGIGYTAPAASLNVNGNVGIGQSTASYALDVTGAIRGDDLYSGDGTQGATTSCSTSITAITIKDGLITSITCP